MRPVEGRVPAAPAPLVIDHLIPSLSLGGTEALVFHLAQQQAADGHQVRVNLAFVAMGDPTLRAVCQRRMQALREQGIAVHVIGSSARDLSTATRSLRRLWRAAPPDVVHAHNLWGLIVSRASDRRVPCVLSLHSTGPSWPRRLLQVVPRADAYVACSAAVAEHYARLPIRIVVVPNGIPITDRTPDLRRDPGTVRVLSVGGIRREKNHLRALAALDTALRDSALADVNVCWTVVGGGPGLAELREGVLALGRSDQVELLGHLADAHDLYGQSDVFLASSDFEGLPMAMLEAMAAGLTCVSTPFPAARDLLGASGAGLVAADFTSRALAAQLIRACADSAERAGMGARARAVAQQHSIQGCAASYEQLYRGA